ncbi:Uncharacterised protein [Candidatus Venteria ishoeyi]|uniref:Uncharacterized protein n=1 Tax=Candidatus Venteria ishoeyi TaxID=1899563 RepID=A0A1H6F755_9GAMM|nr:Uncharacterised protein [Candidatus Venteria ishoeyi]
MVTDKKELAKTNKTIITTPTAKPTGGSENKTFDNDTFKNFKTNDDVLKPITFQPLFDASNVDAAAASLDNLQGKMSFFQENAGIFSDAIGDAFSAMAGSIINSIDTGSVFLDAFVKSILNALTEIASAFIQQLILEKIFGVGKKAVDMGKASSNAIVIATNAAAAMGPAGPIALPGLIASQLAVVGGAFASIAAFAGGGIVDGSSYYGDKILARVNSGELILNTNQQKALYGQLQNGGGVSQVPYIAESRISGSDIKLVLSRQNKRDNRIS